MLGQSMEEEKKVGKKMPRYSVATFMSKESKYLSAMKPKFKDDVGVKMISHKKRIVQSLSDNQKRYMQKFGKNRFEKAQGILVAGEYKAFEIPNYFEMTEDEVLRDILSNTELNMITETVQYLHSVGVRLKNKEDLIHGYIIPTATSFKQEEFEIIEHLKNEIEARDVTIFEYKTKLAQLNKEKTSQQEEIIKQRSELETRAKKIAEMTYNSKCNLEKIGELMKQLSNLSQRIKEIDSLHDEEISKLHRELAEVKAANTELNNQLEFALDRERLATETLGSLQQELANREEKLNSLQPHKVNISNTSAYMSFSKEKIHPLKAILICKNSKRKKMQDQSNKKE